MALLILITFFMVLVLISLTNDFNLHIPFSSLIISWNDLSIDASSKLILGSQGITTRLFPWNISMQVLYSPLQLLNHEVSIILQISIILFIIANLIFRRIDSLTYIYSILMIFFYVQLSLFLEHISLVILFYTFLLIHLLGIKNKYKEILVNSLLFMIIPLSFLYKFIFRKNHFDSIKFLLLIILFILYANQINYDYDQNYTLIIFKDFVSGINIWMFILSLLFTYTFRRLSFISDWYLISICFYLCCLVFGFGTITLFLSAGIITLFGSILDQQKRFSIYFGVLNFLIVLSLYIFESNAKSILEYVFIGYCVFMIFLIFLNSYLKRVGALIA